METSYKRQEELYDRNNREKRTYNWETAIGLNKVDGLTPSGYLLELKQDSIEGRKTYHDVEADLSSYYGRQPSLTKDLLETRECDVVSARIAKMLETDDFVLSPVMLKNIHSRLFSGVFTGNLEPYVGCFRDYNITKEEPVLGGKSVVYGDYSSLDEFLQYDFDAERGKRYALADTAQTAKDLSRFISSLWQVHPFAEGNTRTVAVFLEKYLSAIGCKNVDNTMFRDHSVYFRDALVVSNYANISKGIAPDFTHLELFMAYLLKDERVSRLPEIRPITD